MSANPCQTHFRTRVIGAGFRVIASPFIGALSGAIISAIVGATHFVIVEFKLSQAGEIIFASVYLALIGAVYGFFDGFVTGAIAVPLVFVARRQKIFDLAVVMAIAALLAYIAFDCTESSPTWTPTLAYLAPHVTACAIAAGSAIWFLGRASAPQSTQSSSEGPKPGNNSTQ